MTHKLYLIVGPSGTGKSTLARRLAAQGVPEIVSHTSRSPRDGELDGVHYYFVSVASFEAMIFNDSLVEHVTYGSHHYGTTRLSVATALEQGPACVVVEAGGAVQLKTALGRLAVTLVLAPPPLDDLRRRMLARGDNPGTIEKRLSTVGTEAAAARRLADHVLAPAPLEKLLAEALKIRDQLGEGAVAAVTGGLDALAFRANEVARLDGCEFDALQQRQRARVSLAAALHFVEHRQQATIHDETGNDFLAVRREQDVTRR